MRVRKDGCFGFGARPLAAGSEVENVREAALAAVECARALGSSMREPTGWAELGDEGAEYYETPVEIGPFGVSWRASSAAVSRAAW